ncbi:patatin-like phospholipase family protein [Erythrobacter sp.]|uniref:patatin-like phospholipase family protein n=1 Tax=Erythrobacter sp. TaxID=1042 RepID=UPI001425E2A5|nr:patatin-like phospholipase family protein [Erythrobacter sp.]QIQ86391.1 MAG: alpha/beta hydrolase [Erythrobacter sp.]
MTTSPTAMALPRRARSTLRGARSPLLGLLCILASACAGMERIEYTEPASASAAILPGEDDASAVRFWAGNDRARYDAWIAEVYSDRKASGLPEPENMLVISGGSDKGAYTAGLLNSWSEKGSRPQFDLVTGVSTGALIAPFAFLGSSQDATLKEIYTGIGPGDIYRSRPFGILFGKSALARTEPLQELIAKYTTRDFLERIAAEHRKGRRLLVMTTQLDSGRGMIWDMGAIAARGTPRGDALFRQVLLASASIPGVFPPVFIEANDGTRSFEEMHVDGGVVSSFFVLPLELLERRLHSRAGKRNIWILYNGRLQPKFEVVGADALSILQRSIDVTLTSHDQTFLTGLRLFGERNGVRVALCGIEDDIAAEDAEIFDTERMNQFYEMGRDSAAEDEGCLDREFEF